MWVLTRDHGKALWTPLTGCFPKLEPVKAFVGPGGWEGQMGVIGGGLANVGRGRGLGTLSGGADGADAGELLGGSLQMDLGTLGMPSGF